VQQSEPIFADNVTAQQLFDRVWQRFVVEGAPRSGVPCDGAFSCMYRGPGGAACAVGVLVTDDECAGWDTARGIEAHGPTVGYLKQNRMLPVRLRDHLDLLSALQSAHDVDCSWASRDALRNAFACVAEDFGLTVPS
jgi:hypothetical protein